MTAAALDRLAPARPRSDHRPRTVTATLVGAGFPLSGLLFVASYEAALRGDGLVHELFWAATATALATAAACYHLATDRRRAAAGLAVVLAGLLSLPKFLRAPHYFNFYDELAHWRATQGLVDGSALFAANPLNKVVADYPGLHAVTAALSAVTGGSVFATGTVVILVARIAGALAVYLLAERILRSSAAGLLAVVVFVANPAFAFFDAQFAYESLAAPLVAVVLVLALRLAGDEPDEDRDAAATGAALAAVALAVSLAVVVTHHGSAYVLAVLLVVTAVAVARTGAATPRPLVVLAGAVPVAALAWLVTAGRHTLTYVVPLVRSNLASVPEFLGGTSRPRRLFAGQLPAPAYEQVAAFLAVIVLFGLFGYGAWALLRRYRADDRAAAWVAGLLGLAYFVSLPLVALRADQIAKRLWGFAFIGLAPVAAAALVLLVARRPGPGRVAAAVALLVVAVGSGVTRSGEHIRFPGGYLPSADPRSLTPDVVAAARWLRAEHGPDHRVVGDRTLAAALGSYGEQQPITYQENGRPVWKVFQPDGLRPDALDEIERARLDWIAVDRRAAGMFPLTGFYFDESEPGAYVDTRLSAAGLAKFDDPALRRAYDNGHVVLYQVRR
jgi:hypothetical protein